MQEWVAGFFDAEGTIHIHVKTHERYTNNCFISLVIQMSQYSSEFIAGLFDGDGTMGLSVHKDNRLNTKYRLRPRSRLKLTGHGSVDCIIMLKDFCNDRNIKASVKEKKMDKENWNDGYSISISEFRSVKRFIEEIRGELIVKQEQADIMANKIIPLMEEDKHFEKEGVLEIMAWRDVLNDMKGGVRGKYDLEYFENKWNMKLASDKMPRIKDTQVQKIETVDDRSIFDY